MLLQTIIKTVVTSAFLTTQCVLMHLIYIVFEIYFRKKQCSVWFISVNNAQHCISISEKGAGLQKVFKTQTESVEKLLRFKEASLNEAVSHLLNVLFKVTDLSCPCLLEMYESMQAKQNFSVQPRYVPNPKALKSVKQLLSFLFTATLD